MAEIENEKDDFSKVNVKTFYVFEYDVILKEQNKISEMKDGNQEKKF